MLTKLDPARKGMAFWTDREIPDKTRKEIHAEHEAQGLVFVKEWLSECDECVFRNDFGIRRSPCEAKHKCGDGHWERRQQEPVQAKGPANLPEGHRAYPVVMDGEPRTKKELRKGLCVSFDGSLWPVGLCHNGTIEDGMYLYGWCRDDATKWTRAAINATTEAKWALFRKVEVTK